MLRGFSLFIILLCLTSVSFGQEYDIDISPVSQFDVSAADLESIPDSLQEANIPTETGTQLFSYAKWMFSGVGARELLGETLAPLAIDFYWTLAVVIAMTIIWAAVRILVFTIRFFLWGWRELARAIELIPFVE